MPAKTCPLPCFASASGRALSHRAPQPRLDTFLLSDATPNDCRDIVVLDGFLTALAIGPGLVPPSAWLPVVWGGSEEPTYESAAQGQGMVTLMLRRFEAISHVLALDQPELEPILHVRKHGR